MEKSYSSLSELREELYRLKLRKDEHEAMIAEKFSSPLASVSTLFSLVKGKGDKKHGDGSFLDNFLSHDLVTSATQVIMPFLVNKVFFRKSGFITKAVATFLSQKAAKNVNTNVLTDAIGKVTDFFKKKKHKPAVQDATDYGIPPDSETY